MSPCGYLTGICLNGWTKTRLMLSTSAKRFTNLPAQRLNVMPQESSVVSTQKLVSKRHDKTLIAPFIRVVVLLSP